MQDDKVQIHNFSFRLSIRKYKKCLAFLFFLDNSKAAVVPQFLCALFYPGSITFDWGTITLTQIYYLSFVLPGEYWNMAFRSSTSLLLLFVHSRIKILPISFSVT
jgi:hypothetical protein